MFTGIIETVGTVRDIKQDGGNRHITVESKITHELRIDQSVPPNGVCLTVVGIDEQRYVVTAIEESLMKSNLGDLKPGAPDQRVCLCPGAI